MAKVVILGSGFAGHTAAMYLGSRIGKQHEITVMSNNDQFSYIPSWVWVGVGHMRPEQTVFPLKPVYDKLDLKFVHAAVTEVHPDEGDQYVIGKTVGTDQKVRLDYDYLVIATGPKLNFAGTPGLGPEHGYTHSICSLPHATECRDSYLQVVEKLKLGQRQRIVIGTGHPGATCQGAAFEYIENIHKDLLKRGLRDKADLLWLSNEAELGDFGVHGLKVKQNGQLLSSADFFEAIFKDHDIRWQVQTGVTKVEPGKLFWENYTGEVGETEFDFAMLIPQFTGHAIQYLGADGSDVSAKITNKVGLILVDGQYGLDYDKLSQTPEAWPATYQNPNYANIFAAGIAFAPPGPISKPHTNPNGMAIAAAPPRTGMVSGVIGRVVALNIIDLIKNRRMTHHERLSEMVAACIASMGDSLWDGSAAVMVMHPIVPDTQKYIDGFGRDLSISFMEMGLAGAWMKFMLHHTFIWKFKGNLGWQIIPE